MAITLDGTNGITTPDVESSGPISGTNGTFTGNVGIGTSSPNFALQAALPNTTSSRQIGVTETVYTANFRATYLDLYGASATGTTFGVSNANLGALKFQNTSAGLIGTNDGVPLVFATTSAERMRIDASGNVGIGTSSPAAKLQINGSTTVSSQVNVAAKIGPAVTSDLLMGSINGNVPFVASEGAYPLAFFTNATERMRIDASGNVLVGTTTSFIGGKSPKAVLYQTASQPVVTCYINSTAASNQITFNNPNGEVGQINTSSTTTTYGTSSDYRLKENVQPMQDALAKIAQLNPVTYTWKADGSDGQGFIAHELQAVVPDCVSGEKDAVDAEGKPKYQGVDTSFLVGILTKAIQEQQAMIQALQADIAALKGV